MDPMASYGIGLGFPRNVYPSIVEIGWHRSRKSQMNTSRWITLSDAIFCCCDQRVGSSHPCHPWTQRLGYLDGFRIPRNKQNIPSGKLTQTLKITNFQLKLIFQPLSARVYVTLLEGIDIYRYTYICIYIYTCVYYMCIYIYIRVYIHIYI